MTFTDLLDQSKETLLTQLSDAESPERTTAVLEEALDRLLLRYNSACEDARQKDIAGYLIQTAKSGLPILTAIDEPRVWEQAETSGNRVSTKAQRRAARIQLCGRILLFAGLLLTLLSLCLLVIRGILTPKEAMTEGLMLLSGILVLFTAGILLGRGRILPGNTAHTYRVEQRMNAERLVQVLKQQLMIIDHNLTDAASAAAWDARKQAGAVSAAWGTAEDKILPEDELLLLSDLLENAYGARQTSKEDAEEQISQVRYYLHRHGIELKDFDPKQDNLFEVIPAPRTETLRPAMLHEGHLVRKGLASHHGTV